MPAPTRKRTEFTDRQKAEIFVRDHATCAFSGLSLWVLDYGACPTFEMDWVDHVKPAMKGGRSTVENGVSASCFYNQKKKDNGSDNQFFFRDGWPTKTFFDVYEEIPERIARNLRRFSELETADWFFNRSLNHLLLAVDWLYEAARGVHYQRGVLYYAKAALKKLKVWRETATVPKHSGFLERGLIEPPLSPDQELMLTLADVRDAAGFSQLATKLLPYYRTHVKAFEKMGATRTPTEAAKLLEWLESTKGISPRVAGIMRENVGRLFPSIQ
jgi:hypothetical protein